jgi:rhodanese-related sulfurtransferase
VQTTDQIWQAVNGTDLQGDALTTQERIDVGGTGYFNLVGEAVTAASIAEGVGALWQIGKAVYQAAASSTAQALTQEAEVASSAEAPGVGLEAISKDRPVVVVGESMGRVQKVANKLDEAGFDVKTYAPRNFRSSLGNLDPRDLEANRS